MDAVPAFYVPVLCRGFPCISGSFFGRSARPWHIVWHMASGDTGGEAAVAGRHYDLNDYLPEKRRTLDAWSAAVDEIVTGKKRAPNVSPLASAS